ncbi:MAG: folate/biopterin family MFS transporter, partial [Desulfobacteraceae bacterium]|nr:folate/biopterin family MFS transporter [Desulfobacteraceae bacterium]
WIILFYFLFHFQPAMGALWTNYLITQIHFTQTQIGHADSLAYFGAFAGVLLFAWIGIKWQDLLGLRALFKIFIVLSICINLTQYLMVEPYFSRVTNFILQWFPQADPSFVKWIYFAIYNFFAETLKAFIRMSTFSLVGAVIPVAAAGSLFAGFMSVANLGYSFSYASGAWLYDNGLNFSIFRILQEGFFNIPANSGEHMSILLLIFIGSMAYFLSFLSVHMLPDKRQTQQTSDLKAMISPKDHKILGTRFLKIVNILSLAGGASLLGFCFLVMGIDIIAGFILAFLVIVFVRKVFLDWQYKKIRSNTL